MMIQATDMQRRGHVSKQYGAVTCWQNLAIWPQIFCLPKIVFSSLTLFLFPTVFHTSLRSDPAFSKDFSASGYIVESQSARDFLRHPSLLWEQRTS